ncbi:MAG: response regulator transcription factor [Bacteroidales bacterium]|nr:response regulator transcription factor [Bacteroidales bacterium]
MLRAIVIDDEKPSREVLCNYLHEFCEGVKVVATAASVSSAYKAITKFKPDLIFLDIAMGDGQGFDLLRKFDKIDFRIIFVTAYSEYAIKAFRVNAVDYLLKPVKIDELRDAISKASNSAREIEYSEAVRHLMKQLTEPGSGTRTLVIPHTKGFEVLKINDIIMCQADGYCTNFFLKGKRKVVSTKNLKQYEQKLLKNNFMRVHHSFIINLDYVAGYTRQGEIILEEGHRASLGDTFKSAFMEILGKNAGAGS